MEQRTGGYKEPRISRLTSTFLVLMTLALGILIGTVVSKEVRGTSAGSLSPDATPLQMAAPQQLSNAFATVAKQIEPAVVNINTESTIRPRRRGVPNPDGDDMQDLFDRFFGGGRGGVPEGARQRSLGSGVILDGKGYIVTNAHVVEKADRIWVNLMDDEPGVRHAAKVIGTDSETDLAVIKIEPKKTLRTAKLGNSDSLNVGDWVLAIGSPFGLEQTVTAGIISSKGRNIDRSRQFQSFLQTDAAINPGNSGGPLVNMAGEVIGINTAIFTQTNGSQGVGFALPAKTVADVYNQLIGPGNRVTRGSIGVEFNAVPNAALSRVYGGGTGVVIGRVTPGGPSEAGGLKTGDAIVAIDGKQIKNGDDLVGEISARKPGTKVTVTYLRDNKEHKTTVTVGDRAKLFGDATESDEVARDEAQPEGKFGISVRPLGREMAERMQIPAERGGLLVTEVRPASFGEDIGLERGMVILEINKQPVRTEEDFKRISASLKSGQDVVFLVQTGRGRQGGTAFLAGTLP